MITGIVFQLKGNHGPRSLLGVESARLMPIRLAQVKFIVWQRTMNALVFIYRAAMIPQTKLDKKMIYAAMVGLCSGKVS